jgi:hypothetical protein
MRSIVVSQRVSRRRRAKARRIKFVREQLMKAERSSLFKKRLQDNAGLTDAQMEHAIANISEDLEKGKEPRESVPKALSNSLWNYGGRPINKSAI